ncbi:hypothetical protein FIBSPDRAFT_896864 [Athelia psychrophila]|uniref:Uncharacterized protein n=1 Tax=Athelia psychrophila TaxID=1759441 RepID=A0A166CYH0_9AGAM|nr:hypothetical protein FIBSPDRAFT_896864 [Fibularhizoctonia sp. CBS 109695]
MQKVAAAATYPLPGKSGARVFEWKAEGTYWIRKAMSRGYIEQQWGSMAEGHLCYDSFRNEWDYCELFNPAAEPPEEEDNNNMQHDYYHGQYVIEPGSPQMLHARQGVDAVSSANDAISTNNLRQSYLNCHSGGEIIKPEPMDVILCSRYGFPYITLLCGTTHTRC